MVDIIARIIAQKNNTSIVSQDGFRWTKQQVLDLETSFKSMAYTTQSLGQDAAKRFILSLKKIVSLTGLNVTYIGDKTAGKILTANDFVVKLLYDTSIFPSSGIPSEEIISDGFLFSPSTLSSGTTKIQIVYQGKIAVLYVTVDAPSYTGPDVDSNGNITNVLVDGSYVVLDGYGGVTITWEVNENVI